MEDELFFEAKKYLSSKVAGQRAGYTHDYVSRLARQGKIPGRLVGRTWYVEEDSFTDFLSAHEQAKRHWYDQLSVERKNEQNVADQIASRPLNQPVFFGVSLPELRLYATALSIAIVLVIGPYYLLRTVGTEGVLALLTSPMHSAASLSSRAVAGGGETVLSLSEGLLRRYEHSVAIAGIAASSGYYFFTASTTPDGMRVAPSAVAAAVISNASRQTSKLSAQIPLAVSGLPVVIAESSANIARTVYMSTNAAYATARSFVLSLLQRSSVIEQTIVLAPTITSTETKVEAPTRSAETSPVIIEGPRTIVERVIERTIQIPTARADGFISSADLDIRLEQLNNKLLSEIYKVSSASASGIASNYNVISLTNKIDRLDDITIHNATFEGTVTGLTISGYLSLEGGTLTGALNNTSSATSTFSGPLSVEVLNVSTTTATSTLANGLELTDGCFAINGTCVSGGGGSGTPGGSNTQVQYNNAGSFGGSALFVFDGANVGIGTSTPYTPLTLWDDTVTATGRPLLSLVNRASTTIFTVDDGGAFISNASSTIGGDFTVVGNATTTGDLEVGGTATSTFAGGIDITGEVDIGSAAGTSTVNGGLIVSGSLLLSNLTSCNTIDTDATGQLLCGTDTGSDSNVILRSLGGTTYLSASTTANSWFFDQGFISSASSTINGDFLITGDATTTGLSYLSGGIISSASSTFTSTLEVQGAIGASSTLAVEGIATFAGATTTLLVDTSNNQVGIGTSTLYSLFTLWDDNSDTASRSLLTIANHASSTLFSVDDLGLAAFTNFISQGSSTVSGTFEVASSLGASSTLMVDGLSTLTGLISTASSTFGSTLEVTGSLSASSTFAADGLSTLTGFISIASSTVNGDFFVNSGATTTGLLYALGGLISTGSTTVDGDFFVNSGATTTGLSYLQGGFISNASSTIVDSLLTLSDNSTLTIGTTTDRLGVLGIWNDAVTTTGQPLLHIANHASSTLFSVDDNGVVSVGSSTPFATGFNFIAEGDSWLNGMNIYFGSSTPDTSVNAQLTVSYQSIATSTIVSNQIYAFSIGTTTTDRPIFSIDTTTGSDERGATSTFNGGFNVNSGAIQYDPSANITSIERLNTGALTFDAGAGWVSWINMPTSTSLAAGDVLAYTAQIDSQDLFTLYTEATASSDSAIRAFRAVVGSSTAAILGSSNIPFGSQIITNGALCVGSVESGQDCDDTALSAGQILSGFIVASSTSNASTFAGGLISSASSTVNGDFFVNSGATTTGLSYFTGGFISSASSTVDGDFFVNSGATTTGLLYSLGGLISTGSTTVDGDFFVNSGATTTGLSYLTGLISTASSTFGSTLEVTDSLGASSTLAVDGLSIFTGLISTASSTFGSTLEVTGSLGASSTLMVDGLSTFTGLISTASSTFGSTLEVTGSLGASSTLAVDGIATFAGATTTLLVDTSNNQVGIGTSTLYSLFTLWDDNSDTASRSLLTIANHASSTLFSVDDLGLATFTNFISQGSSTVSGTFEVGNSLGASSTLMVDGLSTFTGLISTASSTFGSTLEITGALGASSTLMVDGLSTFTGLISTASSTFGSTLEITGSLGASSTLMVDGLSTLTGFISTASSTINGDVVFGSQSSFFWDNTLGFLGIGTSSPSTPLALQKTASSPQFRIGYDDTLYADLQVNSAGDLIIASQSGGVYLNENNVFVCTGSTCPANTFTGNGNLQVETDLLVGGLSTLNGGLIANASSTFMATTTLAGAQHANNIASSTCDSTCTIDWTQGNLWRFILHENLILDITSTSSSPIDGGFYAAKFCQDPTGGRTVTFNDPTNLRWGLKGTTTVDTTANTCTYIGWQYDGLTELYSALGSTTKIDNL